METERRGKRPVPGGVLRREGHERPKESGGAAPAAHGPGETERPVKRRRASDAPFQKIAPRVGASGTFPLEIPARERFAEKGRVREEVRAAVRRPVPSVEIQDARGKRERQGIGDRRAVAARERDAVARERLFRDSGVLFGGDDGDVAPAGEGQAAESGERALRIRPEDQLAADRFVLHSPVAGFEEDSPERRGRDDGRLRLGELIRCVIMRGKARRRGVYADVRAAGDDLPDEAKLSVRKREKADEHDLGL